MKNYRLQRIIFLALCSDLGLFSKRLIAPAANLITDFFRIPGGIGTSFSLMFLVIAAEISWTFGDAMFMSIVQSITALAVGMTGNMGLLSPIGYIIPGLAIDLLYYISRKYNISMQLRVVAANIVSAVMASLTANMIVFHLNGFLLILYLSVAAASGSICGCLGYVLVKRLRIALSVDIRLNHTYKKEERIIR